MEGKRLSAVASFMVSLLIHEAWCYTCDSTWLSYNEVCFKYFEENIIHSATKEGCESKGARRISALTPRLKDFLVQHSELNKNSSYWCNTLAEETELATTLGPNTVSPVSTNAPGLASKKGIPEGKCYYIQNKAMHRGSCDELRGFICEKDSIPPPGKCPQGTDKIGASCFWKISVLLDRGQAAAVCATRGGWLANLSSRSKTIYGSAAVVLKRKDFWVGARKQGEAVKWDNGEILDLEENKDFISSRDDMGDCIRLGLSNVSRSGVAWIIGDCNVTAYALCEEAVFVATTMITSTAKATYVTTPMSITTTTPSAGTTRVSSCTGILTGANERDGICYWETSHETELVDWERARQYCQSYGGDLASYKSADEEELGLGLAKGNDRGMWIGLRRQPGSNVFRWSDGSSLIYTNWAPGQPKMSGNMKLCVAHSGVNSAWEVFNCATRRWFVCKMPTAIIPVSPVVPTVEPVPQCSKPGMSQLITWQFYQGNCYGFYVYRGRKFSWNTAKTFCQDNGAFLASVHSVEEVDFLLRVSPAYTQVKDFWIGLRAKGLHSSYQWDDGTPVNFVNWDEDGTYDDSGNINTCVSFDITTGSWKKYHCNHLNRVICQFKNDTDHVFTTVEPTPSLPGFCPDEWYSFGNKCYLIFGLQERETWSGANRKCADIGSSLVSIHSSEEQDFVAFLAANAGSSAWIGMYSTVGGRLFHWTDNSSLDYTNWDENEPNFKNYEEECAHIVYSNRGLGKWNDRVCNMRYPYICQIPKDPMLTKPGRDPFLCAKGQGWLKVQSSCFKIFNESDDHLTWLQAQSFCMSVAGNLASVTNFGISILLGRHLAGQRGLFWIGMRDTKRGSYAWLGTSSLKYTNWLSGQPQGVSDLNNCVAINSEGKWTVRSCYESLPFICEEDKVTPTVAPHDPDMICPNSSQLWKDFGGKFCYIIDMQAKITWYDAAHRCFTQGGSLASFHSADEMKVILHHIKDSDMPLHIGFGQKEDGSFGWLDKSGVDYVNWAPGEPNDPKEMCVEIHTDVGTWNDILCNENRGFICSTTKVPVTESSASELNSTEKEKDLQNRVAAGGIVGIIVCVLVVIAVAAVGFYYWCPSTSIRSRRISEPSSP